MSLEKPVSESKTPSSNQPRLSPEDQARVDRYLSISSNQTERKPFRPWLLMGVIWLVLMVLSGVSYWVAVEHGVI
jgi:hypothetical protein